MQAGAEATDNGCMKTTFDPQGPSVYMVAGGVSHRVDKIVTCLLVLNNIRLLEKTGRDTIFGCLAMPGYTQYREKIAITPEEYLAITDENGIPTDPFIALFSSAWPVKPSFRFLRDGYPPDRDSGGHGVSAVFKLAGFHSHIEELNRRIARYAKELELTNVPEIFSVEEFHQ